LDCPENPKHLTDPKLSARHVTDSAQRILNLIPSRSRDRGLDFVDNDSIILLALWSLLRWERKVGLVSLEHIGTDTESLSRHLDELLTAKAEENPVGARNGVLILKKTGEPYKEPDFSALLEPLLGQAEHEAMALGHNYIGSEHILLAVIKLANRQLTEVFERHGLSYERIRSSAVDVLGQVPARRGPKPYINTSSAKFMVGFQVSINGKPAYTAGIGEFGILQASIEWVRIAQNNGGIHSHCWGGANGLESKTKKHSYWENLRLQVGDEVTVKIVETDRIDPPLPGMPNFPYPE